MDNGSLILLVGLGVVLTALAVLIPPGPSRPSWLPTVLAAGGVALGLVAVLVVALRA